MTELDTSTEAAGQKVEAALAHLQPIRDLAKNWDIDIATCLEEYLGELVGQFGQEAVNALAGKEIEGSAENGPPNFAQAALLLQNSSNVYSRKVEYLHSLVYNALNDLIASSGQKQQSQSSSNLDRDIDEFNSFDPDNEFLLLDYVLPTDNTTEGNKINLVQDDEKDHLRFGSTPFKSTPATHVAANGDSMRLSLGGLSVTRLDRSSILQNVPSTTTATRALMGSIFNEGPDTAGGNLRLLSGRCDVAENGALLMPGSAILGNVVNKEKRESIEPSGFDFSLDANRSYADIDNDDHDDGTSFDLAAQSDNVTANEEQADIIATVKPIAPVTLEKVKEDPWALLDPHDVGTTKPRPLRMKKTYILPAGMDEPPSACVTGARTRKTALGTTLKQQQKRPRSSMCIASEAFQATMAKEHRKRECLNTSEAACPASIEEQSDNERSSVPLKGLVFGNEFAYVAKAEAKRKTAERRERRKVLLDNPPNVASEEVDNLMGFGDDNEGGGDYGFGADDNDDDDGGDFGCDDVGNDTDGIGNTGIASIDDAFESVGLEGRVSDTSNQDSRTFEALCRAHIKAFARGAEQYATETNLTKRVGSWQSRLAPILEEQDQRPEFNIRMYGSRIINTMEADIEQRRIANKQISIDNDNYMATKEKNVVDFAKLSEKCERYEVCRLFLASLMLSNTGNVVVAQDEDFDGSAKVSGSLRFELLDSKVDSPMETFFSPNAIDVSEVAVVQ